MSLMKSYGSTRLLRRIKGDLMNKFQRAFKPLPTIKSLKRRLGCKKPEAKRVIEAMKGAQVWLNDTYEVEIRPHHPDKHWPPMLHLSIKRIDKEPIHDWRHLQEIKNQLVGPECEAVELYPAESRCIDGANQYHLWAIRQPGTWFPIGMITDGSGPARATPEQAEKMGAKQRPFEKGVTKP